MKSGYLSRLACISAVACLAVAAACGDSDNGGGGSPLTPSGPGPGASGATITIDSTGAVTPASVSISVGQSVTFVNNSGSSHEMASDPHPAHTNCPSINAVGLITQGQTKLTNSFTGTGTCTFHDHSLPNENRLKGTISVR